MRPYLIRAVYEWCIDNALTPYIIALISEKTLVPMQYVDGGQIVLNLSPNSIGNLNMTNSEVSFGARFSGVQHQIYLPIDSIYGIYAKENGQGMFFDNQTNPNDLNENVEETILAKDSDKKNSSKDKKSHLKLIK
jgi:stringent starvation protein B